MRIRPGGRGFGLLLAGMIAGVGASAFAGAQEAAMSRDSDGRRPMKSDNAKADAFGSKNWKPAPPVKKVVKSKPMVAAPAPPPPPPVAPALPFTYLGKMIDGEATTVFLLHRDVSLAVKAGDVINNTYRVEQVTETSLTLTYLPLNAQQQMSLGGPR